MILQLIISLIFLLSSGCALNKLALLPGTYNYKRERLMRAQRQSVELARLRAVEARMLMTEHKFEKERLQIEAPKEEA